MVLKPIFQIALLIGSLMAFGWMGIVWFFVAYLVISFTPMMIAAIWEK